MMNANMIRNPRKKINDENVLMFFYEINKKGIFIKIKKKRFFYLCLFDFFFSSFSVNKLFLQSLQQISILTIPMIHIGTK